MGKAPVVSINTENFTFTAWEVPSFTWNAPPPSYADVVIDAPGAILSVQASGTFRSVYSGVSDPGNIQISSNGVPLSLSFISLGWVRGVRRPKEIKRIQNPFTPTIRDLAIGTFFSNDYSIATPTFNAFLGSYTGSFWDAPVYSAMTQNNKVGSGLITPAMSYEKGEIVLDEDKLTLICNNNAELNEGAQLWFRSTNITGPPNQGSIQNRDYQCLFNFRLYAMSILALTADSHERYMVVSDTDMSTISDCIVARGINDYTFISKDVLNFKPEYSNYGLNFMSGSMEKRIAGALQSTANHRTLRSIDINFNNFQDVKYSNMGFFRETSPIALSNTSEVVTLNSDPQYVIDGASELTFTVVDASAKFVPFVHPTTYPSTLVNGVRFLGTPLSTSLPWVKKIVRTITTSTGERFRIYTSMPTSVRYYSHIRKYDEFDNILWSHDYGESLDVGLFSDMTLDENGDVFVIGSYDLNIGTEVQTIIFKFSGTTGEILWSKMFSGFTFSITDPPEIIATSVLYAWLSPGNLVKVSLAGDLLSVYSSTNPVKLKDTYKKDGTIVFSGSYTSGSVVPFFVTLDAQGIQNQVAFTGMSPTSPEVRSTVIDSLGNFYCAIVSTSVDTQSNFIIKLDSLLQFVSIKEIAKPINKTSHLLRSLLITETDELILFGETFSTVPRIDGLPISIGDRVEIKFSKKKYPVVNIGSNRIHTELAMIGWETKDLPSAPSWNWLVTNDLRVVGLSFPGAFADYDFTNMSLADILSYTIVGPVSLTNKVQNPDSFSSPFTASASIPSWSGVVSLWFFYDNTESIPMNFSSFGHTDGSAGVTLNYTITSYSY